METLSTVLVADRDPTQRQLIDMLLAVDQYRIADVDNGREALSFLKENTPLLAILAIDLPDMGGADICGKMKSISRLSAVPVVLIAPASEDGNLDNRTKSLARLVHADLLLQKPLGDKNLRERVRALLTEPQEVRESPPTVNTTQVLQDTLEALDDLIMKATQTDTDSPSLSSPTRPEAMVRPEEYKAIILKLEEENDTFARQVEALQQEIDHLKGVLEESRLNNETLRQETERLRRDLTRKAPRAQQQSAAAAVAVMPAAVTPAANSPEQGLEAAGPADLQLFIKQQSQEIEDLRKRNELLQQALEEERRRPPLVRGLFGFRQRRA